MPETQMTGQPQLTDLRQAFSRQFPAHKSPARVFRAPGRTNLIGEHTDYNDGFVFPAAIDLATWIAIAPRPDGMLKIHSEHFDETIEFNIDDTAATPRKHWSDYVRGIAIMLQKSGVALQGAEILIRSDVPVGAGLSSSASLEVAAAFALTAQARCELPRLEIAQLCQRAENEFVGAHVGIMDQFAACFGKTGHAIFLDCRTLHHEAVPLPENIRLVLCNTMVKHSIAAGDYNSRRQNCEEAVARLAKEIPGTRALRDVTPELLQQHAHVLSDILYKRAHHVVTENARVLAARQAELAGRYVFIFQPAEESLGGGKAMVEGGVLDGLGASSTIGCHVTSMAPVGTVATREGVLMAEVRSFAVTARGAGGHGAAGGRGRALPAVRARAGDVRRSALDPDRAAIHLGWKPWTTVREGVERLVAAQRARSA